MEAGVERLASAGRALDKVRTGLKLVDTVLKIGEGAGLPLIPAVCSAARGVLQVVQESRTVITDSLSAAQRTIDVLELLQLMAQNVKRMDVTSRASVEDRMRELQRLLEDVRSAVAAFGKKGWLRHALNVKRSNAFSQLDSEITSQLDLLLKFYNLARDADIIDRLQAREYAVEAEVERQVAERKGLGEAVDAEALENDREVVRGIAVASGVSDAEFQEELSELRSEMRDGFASTGVKLDEIKTMIAALGREPDRSSRMSLYAYDRRPDAPPGQKDKAAARLGGGTFGSTYRMRKKDGIDELRYAVKFIEDRDSELPQSKLAKEARLLAKLNHPHTVRYFDSFWHTVKARDEDEEDKSQFIIVMELLSGGSLEAKIATPPQPPSAAATWVQQAASGLAYMHSLNLQHRDLKPANVMLDSAGRAKIIDFGLACVSSASRSRTKTKVGTNAYMSPEKIAEKRYGPADDVWAVGCILAELLLGRTIGNVALDPAKRQRAIAECKSASEWLGSWVEGCLQETPGRRPAAAVLEQGLASGGPGAQEAEERSRREAAASAFTFRPKSSLTDSAPAPTPAAPLSFAKPPTASPFSFAAPVGPAPAAPATTSLFGGAAAPAASPFGAPAATASPFAPKPAAASPFGAPAPAESDAVPDVPALVALAKAGDFAPLVASARGGTDGQKEEAAEALRTLAGNADNQVAIARAGGIAPLVALARDGTDRQKWRAAVALANLADNNDENQVAIARAGGIAPLVALARGGMERRKECAATALANLAANADNQVAIAKAGGIAPLVALARGGTGGQKHWAVVALGNLADNADNKVAIARAGGIAPLVALASNGTDWQKEHAAGALWNLADNADNKVAIAKAGGIAPLVALARGGTVNQKSWAAVALGNLAGNYDNRVAIRGAGGIAPLAALARDGTSGQREEATRALQNLRCTKLYGEWTS